jgi:hypothetical protein
MTATAAPLTTAVLSTVDSGRSGVASGFNSAVARGGGLIATAMLGGALSVHGPAFAAPFRLAAWAAAAVSVVASLCALAWVGRRNPAR